MKKWTYQLPSVLVTLLRTKIGKWTRFCRKIKDIFSLKTNSLQRTTHHISRRIFSNSHMRRHYSALSRLLWSCCVRSALEKSFKIELLHSLLCAGLAAFHCWRKKTVFHPLVSRIFACSVIVLLHVWAVVSREWPSCVWQVFEWSEFGPPFKLRDSTVCK